MEKQVIDCVCGSDEHIILFSKNEDIDGYKCVYLSYHLQNDYWYKRIWKGIKYIFGFKSKYGNFGEVIVDSANIHKFKEIVEFIGNEVTLQSLLDDVDQGNLNVDKEWANS